MKKNLFFAAIAVGASLVSCSKSESVSNQIINDDSPVAIQLSLGNSINAVATKGAGALGGVTGTTANIWKGEILHVFMVNHPETADEILSLAKDRNDANAAPLYDNLKVFAPGQADNTNSGLVSYEAGVAPKYYPMIGGNTYDFFAYYIDDAATKEGYEVSEDKKSFYVPFKINGTQDIMTSIAKATASDEANPNYSTDKDRLYSAYAARRGYQPSFSFEHQLAKLNFKIFAKREEDANIKETGAIEETQYRELDGTVHFADKSSTEFTTNFTEGTGVIIDSIKLFDVKQKGNLVVAWNNYDRTTVPDLINWANEDSTFVVLDPETNFTMKSKSLKWDGTNDRELATNFGYILVKPETTYTMTLWASQRPDERYQSNITENERLKPQMIELINKQISIAGNSFLAGHEYDVEIRIFGVDQIEITVNLVGWITSDPATEINNDDY